MRPKTKERMKVSLAALFWWSIVLAIFLQCSGVEAQVTLTWSAPADDGTDVESGSVAGYVLAYGTDSTAIVAADLGPTTWEVVDTTYTLPDSTEVPGKIARRLELGGWDRSIGGVTFVESGEFSLPGAPGDREYFALGPIRAGTYYFAIQSFDESDNWSGSSNIRRHEVGDYLPPGAIINLFATD